MHHLHPSVSWHGLLLTTILFSASQSAVTADTTAPAIPSESAAPNQVTTLDPLWVTETASRIREDIRDVPQSVTIVDQQTLERRQVRTPVQALSEETGIWGVNVAAQGTPIIRGQMGNRVLYLWDGVRINNGALFSGPNGFFNQFPLGALDRIEVIRGSGSVQYGSDAMGGVINLLPKRAAFSDHLATGGDLTSRYGTNDHETTEMMDYHASTDRLAVAAGVTWQDVGDYHGPCVGTLPNTGFNTRGGYADVAWRPAADQVLHLSWIYNRRDDVESYIQSKLNASGVPRIFSPLEERGIVKLDYTLSRLGTWSDELKAYTYYQYYDSRRDKTVESAKDFAVTRTDTNQDVLGFGVQNLLERGKLKLVYGSDYRTEDLASTLGLRTTTKAKGSVAESEPAGNTPDGSYDVFDTFATLFYRPIEPLLLTVGGRFENTRIHSEPVASDVIPNAGYDLASLNLDKSWQSFTWNTGAVYSFTRELDLALDIGSAFRAPTYSDLLSAGTPVYSSKTASVPSPDLDPEQSINFELGPRYHSKSFTSSLAAFYSRLDNMVTSVNSGTVTIPGQGEFIASHKANTGEAYITGVEMDASYDCGAGWSVFGNATYTYGQDTSLDDPLRFIPPLHGKLGLRYEAPSGRWWVELVEIMAGRLTRHALNDELDAGFSTDPAYGSPSATNPPLRSDYEIPGFAVTALRGGLRVWQQAERRLDFTLDLNNLFDTSYREAYAQQQLVAPGFGAVVGAKLTF